MSHSSLPLRLQPWKLVIVKLLPPSTPAPSGNFWFYLRTPHEISLVCEEAHVPRGAAGLSTGWRALEIAGPLDFEQTGVLVQLAAPLAEAKISIFAISSFDTDYVLVRDADAQRALECLRKSGCIILE